MLRPGTDGGTGQHAGLARTGVIGLGLMLLLAGCAAGMGGGSAQLPPPPAGVPPMTASAHEAALNGPKIGMALQLDGGGQYGAAAEAYRQAGDAGNPLGHEMLGEIYDSGDGVRHDPVAAMQQYRLAALAGYAPAATRLGDHYEKGDGVPHDQALANAWYRLAAAQGEDTATSRLALAMLHGEDMAPDVAGALHLLLACAKPKPDQFYHPSGGAGGPGCQALLGAIYLDGDGGVPTDLKTGAAWMQRSASQHMPKAEQHLADLYATGKGVKQDSQQAAYWRQRAAADTDIAPGHWTPL